MLSIILVKNILNANQYLKEYFKKEKLSPEKNITQMEIFIRVNSMKIKKMEKVNVTLRMEINI
jgi:hypothetical protein